MLAENLEYLLVQNTYGDAVNVKETGDSMGKFLWITYENSESEQKIKDFLKPITALVSPFILEQR